MNGPLAGKTLRELIEMFGKELMGERFDGGHFPLIVKLIDAGEHLSLQVHPDEKACAEIGNDAEPKTEMWHILAAVKDAKIIAGFKNDVDKEKIFDNLASGNIEEHLQTFNSQAGDTYQIPAGLVHSIGSGNLILEIQQNSNTTYRLHDWNRRDNDGQLRDLHTNQARKSIRFNKPIIIKNTATTAIQLVDTPYFQVEKLKIIGEYVDTTSIVKSFHLLTAIDTPIQIVHKDMTVDVYIGSTCLMPACIRKYKIYTKSYSTIIKTVL